jgi:hypothetical protein
MTGDFGGGGAYSASSPYRAAVPGRGEFGSGSGSSRGDVLSRGELPRTDWGGSHTSAASSYTSGAGSYMQLQQQQQQHQLPSDFDFSGMHSSSSQQQQQQQQQPPPLQLAATAKAFVPQSPSFRPLARAMSDGGLSLGSRGAFVPHRYSSSGDAPAQSQWTPATAASASDSQPAAFTSADATAAEGSDGSGGGGDTNTSTAAIATGESAGDGEGGASPQLSSSSEEAAAAATASTETAAADTATGTGSSDSGSVSSSGAAVSGAVDIKRSNNSSSDGGSAALPSLGAMAAIAFGKAASTTGTSPPSDPLSGELIAHTGQIILCNSAVEIVRTAQLLLSIMQSLCCYFSSYTVAGLM